MATSLRDMDSNLRDMEPHKDMDTSHMDTVPLRDMDISLTDMVLLRAMATSLRDTDTSHMGMVLHTDTEARVKTTSLSTLR
jgi:hypothetical protein